MKLLSNVLLLGGAFLVGHTSYAQVAPAASATPSATAAPAAAAPAPAAPAAARRPGMRPPLAPRRAVAPQRGGGAQPVRAVTNGVMVKDGVTIVNGRAMYTELGRTEPLAQDKKLVNGTVISPKGLITNPDGSTTQLAEGDYASLTGRITTKRDLVAADSLRKIEDYDRKHPGKRKQMEEAREKAEKAKEKADKERAKQEAKSKK